MSGPDGGTVLAIDAGSPLASVALRHGESTVARSCPQRESSRRLIPLIDEVVSLDGQRLPPAVVVVTRGPGSFTGLRIGLALAWGLAAGFGARLVAVPSMLALAHASRGGGRVVGLVDALRGEVFLQEFEHREGRLVELAAMRLTEPSAVVEIEAAEVVGCDLDRLLHGLEIGHHRLTDPGELAAPLTRLGGFEGMGMEALEPIYGREPAIG